MKVKYRKGREKRNRDIISYHFYASHPKQSKMYEADECYDYPNEWSNEKDRQAFQEALVKTQGLHNHFWLESEFVDLDGQVKKIDRV